GICFRHWPSSAEGRCGFHLDPIPRIRSGPRRTRRRSHLRSARALFSESRRKQTPPGRRTLGPDDALAPGAVDRSVLLVVVVVVMIGVIGVAAMVASVIGHGIPDCRAADTADDCPDRTANNSPGNRAPDRTSDQAVLVGKCKLG